MKKSTEPQKIAVLRYRYLGDTILTLPFISELRKQHPSAEIDWFCSPDMLDIAQLSLDASSVVGFDPKKTGFLNAIQSLKGYDRVYVLKRSFSSALISFLAGIPQRIGFNTEGRGFLLTQTIPYKTKTHQQHEVQSLLDCLHLEAADNLRLPEVKNRFISVDRFNLSSEKPVVAIHAHSSNRAKCWPIEYFAELMNAIGPKVQFVLLGSASELNDNKSLLELCSPKLDLIDLCGQTKLLETLSILKKCSFLIANDSGIPHLASLAKTPQVVLFGPTNPKCWHPLSSNAITLTENQLECRPCNLKPTCNQDYTCLKNILPDEVLRVFNTAYLKNFYKT